MSKITFFLCFHNHPLKKGQETQGENVLSGNVLASFLTRCPSAQEGGALSTHAGCFEKSLATSLLQLRNMTEQKKPTILKAQ